MGTTEPSLEQFVLGLMDYWQPDGFDPVEQPGEDSPPPTLHELFDLTPGSVPPTSFEYDSDADTVLYLPPEELLPQTEVDEEEIDVVTVSDDEGEPEGQALNTPPVSPLPHTSPDSRLTEEMLRCLETMPTSSDDDEVTGSAGSGFETWKRGLEPGQKIGCLRCAWHQEQQGDEDAPRAVCGLCYMSAMVENAVGKIWSFPVSFPGDSVLFGGLTVVFPFCRTTDS